MGSILETRERATVVCQTHRVVGGADDNVVLARTIAPDTYEEELGWDFASNGQALSVRTHHDANPKTFQHRCIDGVVRDVEYSDGPSITQVRPNVHRITVRVREAVSTD